MINLFLDDYDLLSDYGTGCAPGDAYLSFGIRGIGGYEGDGGIPDALRGIVGDSTGDSTGNGISGNFGLDSYLDTRTGTGSGSGLEFTHEHFRQGYYMVENLFDLFRIKND